MVMEGVQHAAVCASVDAFTHVLCTLQSSCMHGDALGVSSGQTLFAVGDRFLVFPGRETAQRTRIRRANMASSLCPVQHEV